VSSGSVDRATREQARLRTGGDVGKKKEGAAAEGRPARPVSRAPLIAGLLVVVAALGIGGCCWSSGGSGGPVRGAEPAVPRVPPNPFSVEGGAA
jgi:hypothetical protein